MIPTWNTKNNPQIEFTKLPLLTKMTKIAFYMKNPRNYTQGQIITHKHI